MSRLGDSDQRQVVRYVDGEMTLEERAAFERRLLAEPVLREEVEGQRAVRACFSAAPLERAPAGLSERVLEAVRRLPSREELLADGALGEADFDREVVRVGRWVLLAAALVFAVSISVWAGVIRRSDPRLLEASDNKLIQRIDADLQAREQLRRAQRLGR